MAFLSTFWSTSSAHLVAGNPNKQKDPGGLEVGWGEHPGLMAKAFMVQYRRRWWRLSQRDNTRLPGM